jgi:hypothetical protein
MRQYETAEAPGVDEIATVDNRTLFSCPTAIVAHRYSAKTTWPTCRNTNHNDETKD